MKDVISEYLTKDDAVMVFVSPEIEEIQEVSGDKPATIIRFVVCEGSDDEAEGLLYVEASRASVGSFITQAESKRMPLVITAVAPKDMCKDSRRMMGGRLEVLGAEERHLVGGVG